MPTARSTDAAAERRKPDCEAVRLNYFLDRKLVAALQQDQRCVIKRNVTIPTTPESRIVVRRANGGYIGTSLRSDGDVNLTTNAEMLVVDTTSGCAGACCFCRSDSRSPRARRRLARELDSNSPSRRRDDRIIMRGTTPPCAKLTGDSGNGLLAALIGDCRLFHPLAENQPQDFLGLLQHHRRRADCRQFAKCWLCNVRCWGESRL